MPEPRSMPIERLAAALQECFHEAAMQAEKRIAPRLDRQDATLRLMSAHLEKQDATLRLFWQHMKGEGPLPIDDQ